MLQIHNYILHNKIGEVSIGTNPNHNQLNSWYTISELIKAEWLIHESAKLGHYKAK